MHRIRLLLYVFVITFFLSCEKKNPMDDLNATENFNRTIKFNVTNVYDLSPITDSVVPGATINIYDNYFDFISEAYPSASRVTDSLGECTISGLDQDYYYIRAKHPFFPDITDSVSTPAYSTSFVELIFY